MLAVRAKRRTDSLHALLQKEIANVPIRLLERLIARKLQDAGIAIPKDIARKITAHILSGNSEPFAWNNGEPDRDISISVSRDDLGEIDRSFKRFLTEQLPKTIRSMAREISATLCKSLKSDWVEQYAYQQAVYEGFRYRLEERWGKPFNLLRLLLTLSRELGEEVYRRNQRSKARRNRNLREVMTRLHVRACQVTAEVISLIENGYADGAIARWRTLHEIGVVATLIADHGDDIAVRYLKHEAVEAKRAMDEYARCHIQLGYRSLSKREIRETMNAYSAALAEFGKDFRAQYGWATHHLKKQDPTFADLEAAIGRAAMRSHYKMASWNVHASAKGLFFKLGLLEQASGLLAGASNFGFADPGQNTAHALVQITALLFDSRFGFADLVRLQVLTDLRDDAVRAFERADRRLRRDEKRCQRLSSSKRPAR